MPTAVTSTSYDGKTIFVGLSNFKMVVADPLFKTAIINNLKLFLMVPVLTLVSLVLAGAVLMQSRYLTTQIL